MFNAFRVQSLEFLRHLSSSFINSLFYNRKIKDKERIRKILVVKTDYLGDLVMATGVLSSLRENLPEAEIVLLTNSQMGPIFSGDQNLNLVIVYDPKFFCRRAGKSYSLLKNLPLLWRLRGEGFDLIVDLSSDPVTILLALSYIFRAYRAERDTLRTKDTVRKYVHLLRGGVLRDLATGHEVVRNELILKRVGINGDGRRLYFPLTSDGEREAESFLVQHSLSEFVVLQPGANFELHRWAPEKFAALGDELIETYGLQAVITGSAGEINQVRDVSRMMKGTAALQEGGMSLAGFASLVSRATLFVGNDSGPVHLAAALKVPTIAVMGTSEIDRYRPWGERVEVCYRPVRCGPCYLNNCYMPENICLQPVEVDQVLEKVDKLLKDRRGIGVAQN